MKPFQIFFFFVSVFLVLLAVTLYFPEEGIKIGDKIKLKFYTASDVFGMDTLQYADIRDIIDQNELINDSIISALATSDSISDLDLSDTLRANADSLKKNIVRIEYPQGDSRLLYPFFRSLTYSEDSGNIVRIMHYGDSQIEGDRMTALLRNRFQEKFGGYGPGLVPALQAYDFSYAILQSNSDNWMRYALYGERDTTINHRRYGALASFCKFEKESSKNDTSEYEAWISFKQSPYSYKNTKKFERCRIFYGQNKESFLSQVYSNNELIDADIFPPSEKLNEINWVFDEPKKQILLKFTGKSSPEIYGVSLEPQSGVLIDNIPMRGCSGNIFTSIDFTNLKSMLSRLDVKLIMLQYGGNVVPHVVDDYSYYEDIFYRQIIYLKKACPEASILVIGLADMSIKEKNHYVTYPNLEKVKEAVRSAAIRAGAAYWDTYKAMGGKNSMPSWVFAEPPLASKDFVHFNPQGAAIIAQMLYNALMYDYRIFVKKELNQ